MGKDKGVGTLGVIFGWLLTIAVVCIAFVMPNPLERLAYITEPYGIGPLPIAIFVLIVVAACMGFFYFKTID